MGREKRGKISILHFKYEIMPPVDWVKYTYTQNLCMSQNKILKMFKLSSGKQKCRQRKTKFKAYRQKKTIKGTLTS